MAYRRHATQSYLDRTFGDSLPATIFNVAEAAYAVVTYRSVSDPEKVVAYAKLASSAVASFGARFLARGNAAVTREQGVKERTVVVEYPSLEKATAAYDSPAYAEALRALGDGAVRDLRIVEGAE
jgi:uncharacterized protein (DUF1330 family)